MCLKAHLKIITKLFLYSKYKVSSITGKMIQFSAVAKKGHLHNIAEIYKEALQLPLICHLVAREFT